MMPASNGATTWQPRAIATLRTEKTPPGSGLPMALSPYPTSAANATLWTSSPRKCAKALIFNISTMFLCVAQATNSKGFYLMFQTLPNIPHLPPFWHNPWQRSPSLAPTCSMSWLPIPVCKYPLPYPASPMPAAISSPGLRVLLICRLS
jgi:hypothetical protein